MRSSVPLLDLILEEEPIYNQYLPQIENLKTTPYKVNIWDIPHSIPKLSYLVHSDYRYYGKFPSVVAGQILEQLPPPSPDHYVLDNFCGSGTTLVEAKLRNIKSFGIDISWLSVLASNVKSRRNNTDRIKLELHKLIDWFESNRKKYSTLDDNFCNKWFSSDAARDLNVIQKYLLKLQPSDEKDFLLIAYLAIIRRVSKAHDGEVRPHINKDKKSRDVISALSKKVNDMCANHNDYSQHISGDCISECYLGDNLNLPKKFNDKKCYLIISHPPYLNSFNYSPVYSLEFYWGSPFEKEYSENKEKLHISELKAHPANESITERYFEHLNNCYLESFRIQERGGYLAIVIGDCTRSGELIPVVNRTIKIVENIGYSIEEINYRTTHYGLGKYAYKHRADYHGDKVEKRDAIIIFKK